MAETRIQPDGLNGRMAVSVAECGRLLGTGQRSVQRWVANGLIRSVRLGRRRLIPLSEIESIIARASWSA